MSSNDPLNKTIFFGLETKTETTNYEKFSSYNFIQPGPAWIYFQAAAHAVHAAHAAVSYE